MAYRLHLGVVMGPTWLLVVGLAVVAAGCEKSAKRERQEAEAASSKVERSGRGVVRELEHGNARSLERALQEHVEAIDDAEEEREEAIAAASKERESYKQALEKEIGWVDQRIVELESENARASAKSKDAKTRDLAAAKSFRMLLQYDLEEIEATGEEVWPELRERIDRDLEDRRPRAVPRAFEKSYGI